jgi:hypothetical protein
MVEVVTDEEVNVLVRQLDPIGERQRWFPFPGQVGGSNKLGSRFRYAADLMPSLPAWASLGVLPPSAECGRSAL